MQDLLARTLSDPKKMIFSHFLATGCLDNGFKDVQFRFTHADAEALRLPKLFSHTRRYLGEIFYHNDLEIIPIEHDHYRTLPKGIPAAYLATLERNKNFMNRRIEPVMGTVMFGRYAGLVFSLFGTKEIDGYFCRSAIQRVIRGERKLHRACVFRHVSHREAIPYHGKLTQEVHEDLFVNKCLKKFKTSR